MDSETRSEVGEGESPFGVVVTAVYPETFEQALTCVAGVHRSGGSRIESILVLGYGLSPEQRQWISWLKGVELAELGAWAPPLAHAWERPGTESLRIAGLRAASEWFSPATVLLWLDAGLCPMDALKPLIDHVARVGAFVDSYVPGRGPLISWRPVRHLRGDERARLATARRSFTCVAGSRPVPLGQPPGFGRCYGEKSTAAIRWVHEASPCERTDPEDRIAALKGSVLRRLSPPARRVLKRGYRAVISKGWEQRSVDWFRAATGALRGALRLGHGKVPTARGEVSDPLDGRVRMNHHGGSYQDYSGLRFQFRRGEGLFVLGNGPSLSEIDLNTLRGVDTLGMNAAYRHWASIGWYPRFYSCLDPVVLESHRHEIKELVERRQSLGIQCFFLRESLLRFYPELVTIAEIVWLERLQECFPALRRGPITTGSHSAIFGLVLGYRRLYLLGVDCQIGRAHV